MTIYDKSLKIIELINDESRNFKYSNNSSLAPYDQAKKVPKNVRFRKDIREIRVSA